MEVYTCTKLEKFRKLQNNLELTADHYSQQHYSCKINILLSYYTITALYLRANSILCATQIEKKITISGVRRCYRKLELL